MARNTQDGRPISITTPLGKDELLLERISGTEGISELFSYQLVFLSYPESTWTFDKLLGQAVTIQVKPDKSDEARYFHGIVSRLSMLEMVSGPDGPNSFIRYRAELVPKVWLLSQVRRSRIFQQKEVPEILKAIFTGYDVKYDFKTTYKPRDYVTQYKETDLAFALRLMEEEGISFYFKHSDGAHQMNVVDDSSKYPDMKPKELSFSEIQSGERAVEKILSWVKHQEVRSNKFTLWDYSFEKPTANNEATTSLTPTVKTGTVDHKVKLSGGDLEIYDWQGDYAKRFDGIDPGGGDRAGDLANITTDADRVAKLRMEEILTDIVNVQAVSDCRQIAPAFKFTLKEHFHGNGNYFPLQVKHEANLYDAYTSGGAGRPFSYRNEFTCVAATIQFRPPRRTPKARIEGAQTAKVVGPSGEEIFTDKYGRVKVQFPWDREGKSDQNSSCWVRVATPWAGTKWGLIHIPRIGMEVLVHFEEGDPDQPIITGCVYNAENMPPYVLPDNKTQSGYKSRSTMKGTEEMFNELRFEDKKDEELIYFHAQKDLQNLVENTRKIEIQGVKVEAATDPSDTYLNKKGTRTETITEGNETLLMEKGNRDETLKEGNDDLKLTKGNRSITLTEGNETRTLDKGSRTTTLKDGNDTLTLEKGALEVTLKQGDETRTLTQGSRTTEISNDDTLTVKTGNLTIKASAGKIEIEAATSIELKCGGSSIKLEPSAIKITSMNVTMEGQVGATVKGNATAELSAGGQTTVKGAMVMIN